MAAKDTIDALEWLRKQIEQAPDPLREVLNEVVTAIMGAEVDAICGAYRRFNVGFNAGLAAGQTVFHAHIHVIPRYGGDVPDPRGGVRHAVVGRGAMMA